MALIVPDNPRAVIAQISRYEPRATDSALDFARHYGTSDRHYYSVPHPLIGQSLDARITRAGVELLHRGQRVPNGPGQYYDQQLPVVLDFVTL